jgi:hypothetical protein
MNCEVQAMLNNPTEDAIWAFRNDYLALAKYKELGNHFLSIDDTDVARLKDPVIQSHFRRYLTINKESYGKLYFDEWKDDLKRVPDFDNVTFSDEHLIEVEDMIKSGKSKPRFRTEFLLTHYLMECGFDYEEQFWYVKNFCLNLLERIMLDTYNDWKERERQESLRELLKARLQEQYALCPF